jgi:hypothetical protein
VPRFFLGLGLGKAFFPGPFNPECLSGFDGRTSGIIADARAGIGRGLWRLEARVSGQASSDLEACHYNAPFYIDGVHTQQVTTLDPSKVLMTDIRVGYSQRASAIDWTLSAGAGWVWSSSVPSVTGGIAASVGNTVRLRLEGEVVGYRLPWESVTGEWRYGFIVQETSRVAVHDWHAGYALRVALDVAPFKRH